MRNNSFWALLGVNWGYIHDEDGENSWLNGVVPAWKILEVLETAPLLAEHAKAEAMYVELRGKEPVPSRLRPPAPSRID